MKKVLAILCALAMTVSCMAVTVFADGGNLALDQLVFVDSIHPTDNYGTRPDTIVDNDHSTRWQSGQDVRVSTNTVYLGIAWDEEISANTFVLYWETSAAGNDKCDLYIAKSNVKDSLGTFTSDRYPDETFYKDSDSIVWEKIDKSAYTYTRENATGGPKYKDTYVFSESLSFYAVKCVVTASDNDKDYMSCHEFEVYNTAAEEEETDTLGDGTVTAETSVVDGVKSVFVATNVAEADVPAGASIKASYTITVDGKTATGEEIITAAYTSIALGDETVTATDITGADAADYVTGILFNNVPENATIEVVFTVAE